MSHPFDGHNIPRGARIVFALQWMPLFVMATLLLLTIPFVILWGMFDIEGADKFIDTMVAWCDRKIEEIAAHAQRVIKLYENNTPT